MTHRMNMFKSAKANTLKEYFDVLPKERKEILLILDKLIKTNVPSLKPNFLYNMPGYGSFKYKNHKKEILDWPTIAIASQKNYIRIYMCAVNNREYIAEKYKHELGKVKVGRSCISFKKLEDVNLPVFKKVLKEAEKNPGLVMK